MEKVGKFVFILVILLGVASVALIFYETVVKDNYSVVDFDQGIQSSS